MSDPVRILAFAGSTRVEGVSSSNIAYRLVTAFDQHAIRAFEVHAVDYLLKPFDAERLAEALTRERQRIGGAQTLPVRDIVSTGRAGSEDQP